MNFIKKIKSKQDNTIKYVFGVNKQVVEFSYIDNNTNKDIICVPCQTMCNMSCTFCHLTDHIGQIPLKNLTNHEITDGVQYIVDDLKLGDRTLLVSYMGCGEPMDNMGVVMDSMIMISSNYDNDIRFGLATMLPKSKWFEFFEFTRRVKESKLNVKVHLSLHFTDDEIRKEWMPASLNIKPSIDALNFYNNITGNAIEIHYTIMDGVNDSTKEVTDLEMLFRSSSVTIKFMRYSEKESLNVKATAMDRIDEIMSYLDSTGQVVEYYEPPGLDVGASCGQFLMDELIDI